MPSDELKALARKLVEYNNSERINELLDEVYHPDCVSVEAFAMPGTPHEIKGLDAIKQKHEWWHNTFEVHSTQSHGPYFNGESEFAVIFEADTTMKPTGERSQMKEVAIYTVEGGKIVKERFFYDC